MWTQKTKNGKYRAFERYPLPDGSYKTLSALMDKDNASTRKAALAHLNAQSEKLYIRDCTLADAVTAYLADAGKTKKPQTVTMFRSRTKTMLEVLGANIYLSKLTAGYIRSRVIAQDKPDTWKNGVFETVKRIIRWAYRNDYIKDTSAADKLQPLPSGQRSKKEKLSDKYLTRSELRVFLNGIPDKFIYWKLVTEFLALSGLRFGEFAALHTSDFLPSGYISINKTYNMVIRADSTPKTEDSTRLVYIQPELAECISRINAYTAGLRFKHPELRSLPYWFPNPKGIHTKDGGRLNYESFDSFLRVYAPRIIGKHISAHTLRHTHASLLFEAGFSVDEVGRRLGHKNGSAVTREIYIHITNELKAKDNQHLASTRIL